MVKQTARKSTANFSFSGGKSQDPQDGPSGSGIGRPNRERRVGPKSYRLQESTTTTDHTTTDSTGYTHNATSSTVNYGDRPTGFRTGPSDRPPGIRPLPSSYPGLASTSEQSANQVTKSTTNTSGSLQDTRPNGGIGAGKTIPPRGLRRLAKPGARYKDVNRRPGKVRANQNDSLDSTGSDQNIDGPKRKRKPFKKGTLALREIRRLQKSTDRLIPALSFQVC